MGFSDWRPFLYGGLASCTAEFGTFPIDTTKTRLQIQGQICDIKHSEVKYRGMLHALLRIYKEEGVRALYYGISPAVLRQATYGTIKFGIYYSLKSAVIKYPEDETLLTNVCCAVSAGVLSSAMANPTDVLKVRMQARNEGVRQKTLVQCFQDVYRQEGIAGLWRGVGPTSQRAAVVVGVELPLYDFFKRAFLKNNILGDTPVNHFLSSFLSSLGGAIASTPLDVIKTRLMNQRKLKAAVLMGSAPAQFVYSGSMDCLLQTVKHEGPLALYRGFIPNWLRLGPWNIIFFVTYEQLKRLY